MGGDRFPRSPPLHPFYFLNGTVQLGTLQRMSAKIASKVKSFILQAGRQWTDGNFHDSMQEISERSALSFLCLYPFPLLIDCGSRCCNACWKYLGGSNRPLRGARQEEAAARKTSFSLVVKQLVRPLVSVFSGLPTHVHICHSRFLSLSLFLLSISLCA